MNAIQKFIEAEHKYLDLKEIDYKEYEQMVEPLRDVECVVRCNECKHRPTKNLELEQILEFPDSVCPCQNPGDDHYSWYPADDWYCADGERR